MNVFDVEKVEFYKCTFTSNEMNKRPFGGVSCYSNWWSIPVKNCMGTIHISVTTLWVWTTSNKFWMEHFPMYELYETIRQKTMFAKKLFMESQLHIGYCAEHYTIIWQHHIKILLTWQVSEENFQQVDWAPQFHPKKVVNVLNRNSLVNTQQP